MEFTLIGDIHCSTRWLMSPGSIQLGDLCLMGYQRYNYPGYFIDGNHDHFPNLNPDADEPCLVNDQLYYIPRGYVSDKVMFIGGANSIDKNQRTAGYDWFPEESITQRQMYKILNKPGPIEVILSHDCPSIVYGYEDPTTIALTEILLKFKPKLWIFAHHHRTLDITSKKYDCRFICVAMNEQCVLDLPMRSVLGAQE